MSKKKLQYRVHNWPEYNDALVQGGSLTLWIEESVLSQWHVNERKGKRGAPTRYSDGLIQMALVLREAFHLPLRTLQGFLPIDCSIDGFGRGFGAGLYDALPTSKTAAGDNSQAVLRGTGSYRHRQQWIEDLCVKTREIIYW